MTVLAPIKSIPTRYKGFHFRSRLEARWAVAFDHEQIEWVYEPEGVDLGADGLYLPDFWLPQVRMWAEVKPDRPSLQELKKANALAQQSQHSCLLLIGQPQAWAYYAFDPISQNGYRSETLADGTSCAYLDYSPFEGSRYHLSEARFFAGCGCAGDFPMPWDPQCDPYTIHPAIAAARSARFEHGQSGPS